MDAKLHNAYVEVLLDNFLSVVKQNVMFQAQLQVLNSSTKENADTKNQLDDVSKRNVELQSIITSLENKITSSTGEINTLKNTVSQKDFETSKVNNLRIEKDRLQAAANDYMRQIKKLQEEIVSVKSESQDVLLSNSKRIDELSKYVYKLEQAVPVNKLKKIKVTETPDVESNVADSVKSGGTF